MINYPDQTQPAFNDIKTQILDTPLSLSQLQSLRDLIEDQLTAERYQYHLFMVGDRTRESARDQFGVLCQALEMNSIGVMRLQPVKDDGELMWTITQRNKLVHAVLVLRADDTWEVRPLPLSDRRQSKLTPTQAQDIKALNSLSLTAILFSQQVDIERLGGWKLAS